MNNLSQDNWDEQDIYEAHDDDEELDPNGGNQGTQSLPDLPAAVSGALDAASQQSLDAGEGTSGLQNNKRQRSEVCYLFISSSVLNINIPLFVHFLGFRCIREQFGSGK
jgi:hypothetical protein